MEFSIMFDIVKSEWSIVYVERSQAIIYRTLLYFFLWIISSESSMFALVLI